MKKRLLSYILVLTMVLIMTACGSDKEKETTSTNTTGKSVKVGLVTDVGGVNDGSFNQSSLEGLQRAGKELGIQVNYLESKTDADYKPNIQTFLEDDYDLIICIGKWLEDATREAAEDNPKKKFAIIDDMSMADMPNVTSIMFEQSQSAYLAGIAAGKMTKTNTVGFVIGRTNEIMNQFGYGYFSGVLDANSNAKILQINANSFTDTAAGKSAAVNMVTNGADIIFQAAGATGLGVIEGCKESNIWAIGVDSDQSSLAPKNILTSAMKRVDNACYDIAKCCQEGTIKSGVITYDLKNQGVDIAPTKTNLTDDVVKAIEETKQKIKSGEITVPKTKKEFEKKYGDIYELD
ncbi:BMP family lipoprotein [Anaerosacchariphilus polymeriproducens]|uniref:BMP family ABC transporter substrate-binding protein n=1 Tax=Anaerosacchariphilus polymeriproducens TaxID=1812858 RepID=A0A371AZ92_9FIRM|nr:BMP family ABC transporter substrate-binding protein [Anaerosacchariphilus polymeriproducens]RDU24877.1 BMP family ABC transporter substrate-binding protein [Anaerosacchariphilus polymeriproducens]